MKVAHPSGETRIPLAAEPTGRGLVVQGSAFNLLRQRSEPSGDVAVTTRRVIRDGAPRARDDWGPRVWKAFHRQLLEELTRRGAATIAELEQRRTHMLELALDRLELVAVVDSARRAGLVAPLGQEHRADGTEPDGPEWAPTDAGRRRVTSFLPWLFRGVAVLPFAVLATVGKEAWPWLEEQDTAAVLLVTAGIVFSAVALGAFFHRRLGGASTREVAGQWSRHAVELPALNRALTWRPAKVVPIAAVSALCVALFVGAVLVEDELSAPLIVAAAVAYLIGALGFTYLYAGLLLWLFRRLRVAELRMEAAAWRDDGRIASVRRVPRG